MTQKYNRFRVGSGVYVCQSCGKRTRDVGDGANVRLCLACYDLAGWENAHSDENHSENPNPNCPVCKGVK